MTSVLVRVAMVSMMVLLSACDASGGGGTGGGTGGGSGGTGGGTANLPDPTPGLTGARVTWRVVSYIAPPGMTETPLTDGLQLKDSGNCTLFVLQERAAEADAAAQARAALFTLVGSGFSDLHDEYGGTNAMAHKWRGLTPEGFPYVIVRGYLVDTSGQEGSWARSALVNLGATVLPIVGLGDKSCFEDQINGKNLGWEWLLHSLQFPGATPPSSPSLASQLLGKWQINSGTIFIGETFAANGHYANASAYQTYSQVSSTEVLQTTTTFLGDGTFEAHQDRLTRTPTSGTASTHLFSIVEEENTSAPNGWLPTLDELETSSSDGSTYQSLLRRDPS